MLDTATASANTKAAYDRKIPVISKLLAAGMLAAKRKITG